jgi:tetratricopeptide (TPR) repeat protein
MLLKPSALLLLALALADGDAHATAPAAEPHLLAGARLFRQGDFKAALVEFEVARGLGAGGEASWYLAATLSRAGRAVDALEAFARARQEAPDGADPLLEYYEAVACHDAQLLLCAQTRLAGIGERAGPRIAELVERISAEIRPLLEGEPPASAIDALLVRGDAAARAHRPLLAQVYFEEARALSARRQDGHRAGEATARLGAAGTTP